MPIAGPTINHREIRHWADLNRIVPIETLPHIVDHEPAVLQLIPFRHLAERPYVRRIDWDEFFARFDLLNLAFVYDDDNSGYNELLQRDETTAHVAQCYRAATKQPPPYD